MQSDLMEKKGDVRFFMKKAPEFRTLSMDYFVKSNSHRY